MKMNETFYETAMALTPTLQTALVSPASPNHPVCLKAGETLLLDFGTHYVGSFSMQLRSEEEIDAPAWLSFRFAEHSSELKESPEDYHGWISSSWIQQEVVHIDEVPSQISLPRRYAFRYVEITCLHSAGFSLILDHFVFHAVSSAEESRLLPWHCGDELLERIDQVACRTLHDCMQEVFEDGPKWDRRLWLGDLRIQARVNYVTYRENNLVKRCLYLFASQTLEDGRVASNFFLKPKPKAANAALFDYSLFFVSCLNDYYQETRDETTLRELWPTAKEQILLASRQFGPDHVLRDGEGIAWSFVDWSLTLNKQAASHGIYLSVLKDAMALIPVIRDTSFAEWLDAEYRNKARAAAAFWDAGRKLYVSGPERQVSWATQIWMVLAGVCSREEGRQLLDRVSKEPQAIPIATPYLYSSYVEALFALGEREQALESIKSYWGGMIQEGADTFWEMYRRDDPDWSPYGGKAVNSYCHAWSCSPSWFLRRENRKEESECTKE